MTDPIQRSGAASSYFLNRPAASAGAPATPPAFAPVADGLSLSNPVALTAARLKAALPPGVEMKVDGDRISLSRAGSGEPLYTATYADGKWSHGGYRQHGIMGPPERPGIMQAFEKAGIVQPKPPEAPPAPEAPTAPKPAVATPSAAGYERIAKMLAAQLPGIDVKASETGIQFSRNGEGFYSLSVRDGQWSSGGYRQHGIRGHADSPAVREVLKANGYGN